MSRSLLILTPPDSPPAEAVDLFGGEVRQAFEGGRIGDVEPVVPLILAHPVDAGWAAGVLLLLQTVDGERVASIRQLIVRPSHRGRGLAGRLLRAAREEATRRGVTRLRSTAGWGCPDHLRMYDRLGFERVREESPYLVSLSLEASSAR